MTRRTTAASTSLMAGLRQRRLAVLALLLFMALCYVAVPQLGFFDNSWSIVAEGKKPYLLMAAGCLLLSYLAATVVYRALSPKLLKVPATYIVQMVSSFAGRVLPAGVGSVSVNYLYLRRQGLSAGAAAAVVATNNLLGLTGHGIWLLLVVLVAPTQLSQVLPAGPPSSAGVVWLLLVVLLVVVLIAWWLRSRLARLLHDIRLQLRRYRRQPVRLLVGLIASMLLTACNIAIVWLAAQAFGLELTLAAAAVALTVGVAAQTATPTPGGIGGAEAGLAAGLILSGMTLSEAVATTLTFRLITFWLPLLLGGLALIVASRRRLL